MLFCITANYTPKGLNAMRDNPTTSRRAAFEQLVTTAGGKVVAAAALVDRSAGTVELGVPFYPLIELNFPTWAPDELPPELAGTPAVKPGSRARP